MGKMKRELLIIIAVLVTISLLACGCQEEQKTPQANIKPIDQQLIPTDLNWIRAYGDTIETQMVFNLTVLRNDINVSRKNELVIANVMNLMHPADVNDPNNLKVRIEKLEAQQAVQDSIDDAIIRGVEGSVESKQLNKDIRDVDGNIIGQTLAAPLPNSNNLLEGHLRYIPKTFFRKGYMEMYDGREWRVVDD